MKTIIKTLLLFISLLISPLTATATFTKATELYDEGAYEAAFAEFNKLAKIGHKPSQFNLGVMYLEGTGTQQDLVNAYAWVKLSDEEAQKEEAFLSEIKGYLNSKEKLLKAKNTFLALQKKYGSMAIVEKYRPELLDDKKVKQNEVKPVEQARAEYPKTAQYRGIEGWVTIEMHVSPSGFPTDLRIVDSYPEDYFKESSLKALKKWRFESNEGRFKKVFTYRLSYELGSTDHDRFDGLKENAVKGDPASQYLYGKYGNLDSGRRENGYEFNSSLWYFEAARNGVVNAQHEVAKNLLKGDGCEADPQKAIAWFTIAAASGYEASKFQLAKLSYDKGNSEQGLNWLKQSFDTYDIELSYDLVSYVVHKSIDGIDPSILIEHLDRIMDKNIKNPVMIYHYYARAHELAGNIEEAIEYQEEAIEELEDLGEENIPEVFTHYLVELKGQLKKT